MGSSKKKSADSRTIRKSTREESIDTLQAASIDNVNQASNDTIQLVSDNTVHRDAEYMILVLLLDDIMAKRDEQHVFGELSRIEEAGTKDPTSTSIDNLISTSTDITTLTSTDIMTSASIDVTTSSSTDDVDREVTMEELEEWLEDMDQNSKKKPDDDQHTSRGDLDTSKASTGRHQPDDIDRQPLHIIDLHPPDVDRHRQPFIDRHHPPNIDQ
ncbi:hypothetical protein F2Q70_00016119 [Brassica cretica]|uniref:Uncharacterized protein n=1 Tax=Brassica cretica TaxID=69181 RepID=A0A8S9HXW8_BRACR|nr:hypothetical protein F2Q70_00016119 [Brassica cretica]